MTTRIAIMLAGLALLMSALRPDAALAVLPDERLDDPTLEARAREISSELRCVVCQNQSIDDSNAEIARDLRLLVRERLVAGDTDEEVVEYVVARYGDFVRLRPPFQENTLALWLGPPIMAIVIATLAVLFYQAWLRKRADDAGLDPLSPDDRAELDALVERIASTTPPAGPKSSFRSELDNPRAPPEREDEREPTADDARQDGSTARDEDTSAR